MSILLFLERETTSPIYDEIEVNSTRNTSKPDNEYTYAVPESRCIDQSETVRTNTANNVQPDVIPFARCLICVYSAGDSLVQRRRDER